MEQEHSAQTQLEAELTRLSDQLQRLNHEANQLESSDLPAAQLEVKNAEIERQHVIANKEVAIEAVQTKVDDLRNRLRRVQEACAGASRLFCSLGLSNNMQGQQELIRRASEASQQLTKLVEQAETLRGSFDKLQPKLEDARQEVANHKVNITFYYDYAVWLLVCI
ncbi:unnamed protein product [Protopolystoma xenopodis]|uniref:Uncharacterized protein n=1 Tax=Protopolystoma xenopodis TaxID=117903 RepID=A0A3S5A3H0_9PLAT|nr:unnamed protein product [Protopolystoma xenopodis]